MPAESTPRHALNSFHLHQPHQQHTPHQNQSNQTKIDSNQPKVILDLIQLRKATGVNARSKVTVRKAAADVYAATVDDKLAMKIGRGDWSPGAAGVNVGREWRLAVTGQNVAVWVAE